ncbi:unnamed protein product [Menidia menidia]|uniref:(Atlantic silverside) hypothetical protein n=1 Tax=Menidia menidia TaxID=238744 RepID=A0A8S4AI88_9TELE|nr:unnamed protein product [Menidia menidia]
MSLTPARPFRIYHHKASWNISLSRNFWTVFLRLKMSLKRRLVSMFLCCVYCLASLFCLHPNRNNWFSAGARNLVSVVQQLYQRVIRLLRTTL